MTDRSQKRRCPIRSGLANDGEKKNAMAHIFTQRFPAEVGIRKVLFKKWGDKFE